MSFLTSLWQLPFVPFCACIAVIGLWLLAFIQRMHAAAINDRSHSFSTNGTTIRRFGLGPGNRYLFYGHHGWERIIGYDYHKNSYITDGFDREARIRFEIMQRGLRRRQAVLPLAALVLLCVILRLVILPAPLSVLLHPLADNNYAVIAAFALNNIKMLVDYLIGAQIGSWDALLSIFILVWLPLALFFSIGRILANAYNVFTFAAAECLYLAGYQNMQGAKVFDAVPGARPLQDQPGLLERLRLNLAYWWAQHRRKRAPDADEAADTGQQHAGARGQRTRDENAQSHAEDPTRNIEDAYRYFGLASTCTKQELEEVFRKIIKQYNTDQQPEIPEAVRLRSQEIMKTTNAARDLIRKYRGWR